MKTFQKIGGLAALIDAATYLFAMGLLLTVLTPLSTDLEFSQFITFYLSNQTTVFIWHLISYMINGVFLVLLALALYERLKVGSPAMAQVATVFGLIWAVMVFASGFVTLYGYEVMPKLYSANPEQAAALKVTIDAITLGLDHSDRFLGCLWVLFVSWAALRSGALPKPLNYLGLLIGVPGLISTVLPSANELAYAFGLGVIIWWSWLGIVLLLTTQRENIRQLNLNVEASRGGSQ